MMQKKMRFQINEMGEVETVFWFSDPFSVTGEALLSHPSDTGDNELTALWTEAGGINKSKFISPAPKASQSSSGLSAVVPESRRRLFMEPFGRDGCGARKKKAQPGVRTEQTTPL